MLACFESINASADGFRLLALVVCVRSDPTRLCCPILIDRSIFEAKFYCNHDQNLSLSREAFEPVPENQYVEAKGEGYRPLTYGGLPSIAGVVLTAVDVLVLLILITIVVYGVRLFENSHGPLDEPTESLHKPARRAISNNRNYPRADATSIDT
jgi:hypothetical protein